MHLIVESNCASCRSGWAQWLGTVVGHSGWAQWLGTVSLKQPSQRDIAIIGIECDCSPDDADL